MGSCRRRHWPRWGPARESERTKVNRVPLRRGALGGIRISGGAARPNDDFLEGQPEGGARALSRPFTAPATATMPVARLRGPCGSGRSGLGRAFAFGGRRDIGLGRDAGRGGFLRLGAESSFGRARARAPWSSLRGLLPWVAEWLPRDGAWLPRFGRNSYLVDPASSHMLVSKIKPCMCKYKLFCTVKLRMAH